MTIKDIPGYGGRYQVDDLGAVYSTINTRGNKVPAHQLKQRVGSCGYMVVQLRRNGKNENRLSHTLVARAFHGCAGTLEVNHIDGNKRNNSVSNLEYVTHKDNVQHAHRTGLTNPAKGERVSRAKLSSDVIQAIRKDVARVRNGGRAPHGAMKALSQKYGVSPSALDHVAKGDSWRHIPDPEPVVPEHARAAA